MSTSTITSSSRSSMNCLTNVLRMRPLTFQSIRRTSSPGTYSRTSSKSMPRPLKIEADAPAMSCSEVRRDLISTRRMRLIHSLGIMEANRQGRTKRSRHRHLVKDPLHDLVGGHLLGLRLVGQQDAV